VPAAGQDVVVVDRNPVAAGSGAAARNGIVRNQGQINKSGRTHGVDGRLAPTRWSAAEVLALPATLAIGDRVLMFASAPEGVVVGAGVTESVLSLEIRAVPPAATVLSAPPIVVPGVATPDIDCPNLDALVAGRRRFSSAGLSVPPANLLLPSFVDRQALGFSLAGGYTDDAYEAALPHRWYPHATGRTNYGLPSGVQVANSLLYSTLDICDDATARAIWVRSISTGAHLYHVLTRDPDAKPAPNGGTAQWPLPMIIHYLWATGQTAKLATLATDLPFNQLGQLTRQHPLLITQLTTPHSIRNGTAPWFALRRAVVAVGSSTIDVELVQGVDTGKFPVARAYVTNGAGKRARVVSCNPNHGWTSTRSSTQLVLDSNPFSPGDVVWFEPAYPLVPGRPDFYVELALGGYAHIDFCPTAQSTYRNIQNSWTAGGCFIRSLGIEDDDIPGRADLGYGPMGIGLFYEYLSYVNAGGPPADPWSPLFYAYAGYQFDQTFWAAHGAALGF